MLLIYLLGVIAFLIAAGVAYQAVGNARDARKYPPPGRLVQTGLHAGGHRMHLYATGEGRPTVVLDAALAGSCLSWAWVQPELAKFARACSYDRAGLGWSDAAPTPRTARQCAEELHSLLERADVPGPYVLVGHSFGGFVSRLFAAMYPAEVAGMVLVDVPHPKKWREMSVEERHRVTTGARLSRRGTWAVRLGLARFIYLLVEKGALGAARSGVKAVSGGVMGGSHSDRVIAPIDRLPSELRPLLRTIWVQARFFNSLASHIESMPETARQLDECGSLGDKPLVVLTASRPSAERMADQEAMARLSARGRHIVAQNSGHWIPLDDPALVVHAIRTVVEQLS